MWFSSVQWLNNPPIYSIVYVSQVTYHSWLITVDTSRKSIFVSRPRIKYPDPLGKRTSTDDPVFLMDLSWNLRFL